MRVPGLVLDMSFGGLFYDPIEDRLKAFSVFVSFESGGWSFFEPIIGDIVKRPVGIELPTLVANEAAVGSFRKSVF